MWGAKLSTIQTERKSPWNWDLENLKVVWAAKNLTAIVDQVRAGRWGKAQGSRVASKDSSFAFQILNLYTRPL